MPSAGERPGAGTYFCMKCGERIVLKQDADELPVCPRCGHTEFLKLQKSK
ncbi:MAG: hypothetical protein ABIA75_04130 [Candidatus Neomarinimicrobiota bacterium]